MGVFIFSYPRVVPPTSARRFPMSSQWIGYDGSVWDLHSGSEGVVLLNDGVTGLHFPKFDRYLSSSRAMPGHRLRGTHAKARTVVWPLLVHGESQASWLTTEQGFWHTIRPELAGTWKVGVGSQYRTLQLTGLFDDEADFPLDPYRNGWAKYVLELEAAQPFWKGEDVSRRFEVAPASTDFFDVGGSPPFHISPSSTFSTAAINNPGDVPVYPVWTLVGPLTAVSVGVGGVTIDLPDDLILGDTMIIDTDPRNQTATLNGVDATVDLGFQSFAAIDPGMNVPLTVVAGSTGNITCQLTPLYYRAW